MKHDAILLCLWVGMAILVAMYLRNPFKPARTTEYAFFRTSELEVGSHQVTIATQLSVDRMDRLIEMSKVWNGPISATIYISPRVFTQMAQLIAEQYDRSETLRRNVDIHLYYDKWISTEEMHEVYPSNLLRNIAVENVRSEYVLVLDVDFVPNPTMQQELAHVLHLLHTAYKTALVIPAFEMDHKAWERERYPVVRDRLVKLYRHGDINYIHYFKGKIAHSPTDYEQWSTTTKDYYPVEYRYMYEPYVVLRTDQTPKYDERFRGYGNDKTSFTYELAAAGFQFKVVTQPYIIHSFHQSGAWTAKRNRNEPWVNWVKFIREIEKKYNYSATVPEWFQEDCRQGNCPAFWLW